ncbi:MAG: phosphonate C-P lyase system protein PhnG [Roseiflexaceae bacterium]|nr:phosphonate C-P lyase system protein PhnG [Roseiflexaceae bacterium]
METDHADQQSLRLGVLSRAPAEAVKLFADALIPELGAIEVLRNRTGLVMLPMADTVSGAPFYVGEVLLAEAHVRLASGEGYAACLGRDLEQALALALIDAAAGTQHLPHIDAFVAQHAAQQTEADTLLRRQIEATRVEMETF